jgi:galactonate dehydratase
LTCEQVPVYNTCAGYTYNKASQRRVVTDGGAELAPEGPYEDQEAFVKRPAQLAESLLSEGYKAMKIWPFDPFAASQPRPGDLGEGPGHGAEAIPRDPPRRG